MPESAASDRCFVRRQDRGLHPFLRRVEPPYSPARPQAPPPYGTIRDLLAKAQTQFWCVNLAPPAAENPIAEDEHLLRVALAAPLEIRIDGWAGRGGIWRG